MNKLLLNQRARNHIRFFPMPGAIEGLPEDEGDRIRWCKAEFERLQNASSARRAFLRKHTKKGYLISVWELDGLGYMVLCIKNEFGTFNSTIYLSRDIDDLVAIAKAMDANIESLMADYRSQILEARDWLLSQPKEAPSGDA